MRSCAPTRYTPRMHFCVADTYLTARVMRGVERTERSVKVSVKEIVCIDCIITVIIIIIIIIIVINPGLKRLLESNATSIYLVI